VAQRLFLNLALMKNHRRKKKNTGAAMISLKSNRAKWTYFGILSGCLFPLVGIYLEIRIQNLPFSWANVLLAHSGQQTLWLVDLAPFVLGLVFNYIGKREQDLEQINSDLSITNKRLIELQGNLEQRVKERTSELELVNQQNLQRAEKFESISQISRVINSIQKQEDLLAHITRMISEYFKFYHVGIFLLDDSKQFAVLRAANSDGGQIMLKRRHRLQIGQKSIVGFVTSTGKARISLDTGTDTAYFDNPDLQETRSEMALPLKVGRQMIGALDVQSTEPNAFTQEDVNILSTLADQVSVALDNARLHEEAQSALAKAEIAYRQLIVDSWSNVQLFAPVAGYRFDGTKAEPLNKPENSEQPKGQQEALSVPVLLRGESIGRLRIKPVSDGYQWSEDEIAIVQATAERVALAVENARLVIDSQKRASKEQIIGEASTKISSAINLDNILQTTLREVGRILPGAEISIQVEKE